MEQYIPKSVVLAEINKRLHQLTDAAFDSMIGRNLIEIRDSIDTLEVKGVDLDFEQELYKAFGQVKDFTLGMRIAKHFFELGLRCKSSYVSIPNIDDTLKEMGVDPNSKDAKIFKESYYMALEKLKAQKEEYENRS